ncbi:MAG: hypothetical protein IPM89_16260 [Candidatus Competibacteraceae bacterium]|nr:MAG: hypothetical protein IPM89_16260 [Candidatus Competibacteraceae bacterium]
MQDLSAHPALKSPESAQAPIIYQEAGQSVVAYTQKINLGWTLIIQQDYDDAFAPLLEARQRALFLIAGALVLVIVVAYLLSRQLASPISGTDGRRRKHQPRQLRPENRRHRTPR